MEVCGGFVDGRISMSWTSSFFPVLLKVKYVFWCVVHRLTGGLTRLVSLSLESD